jgi:hypothetical protein
MVAIAAIVAMLGSALVLARLSDEPTGGIARLPTTGPASSAPTTSSRPSAAPRVERLIEASNVALPHAPSILLFERVGDDLGDIRIRSWSAGEEPVTVRTLPGAVPDDGPVFPVLAPDHLHVMLLSLASGDPASAGSARLLGEDGASLWSATGISASSGAVWSEDSRLVVLAAQPRQWRLVRIGDSGRAREQVVKLPFDVYLPSPIPIGSITVPDVEPRTIPVGFSADGRWVYGGVVSPQLNLLIGAFRVSVKDGSVERVRTFGVGEADGLAPRPGTLGPRLIDPVTGRIATGRINSDTTGGPQTVEVRAPDSSYLFSVDAPVTVGTEWGPDGGLFALTTDSPVNSHHTELVRIGADGTIGPSIVETGPITAAMLIGVSGRYAAIAILAFEPSEAAEVVLIDVDDPTIRSAVPISIDGNGSILGLGLEP